MGSDPVPQTRCRSELEIAEREGAQFSCRGKGSYCRRGKVPTAGEEDRICQQPLQPSPFCLEKKQSNRERKTLQHVAGGSPDTGASTRRRPPLPLPVEAVAGLRLSLKDATATVDCRRKMIRVGPVSRPGASRVKSTQPVYRSPEDLDVGRTRSGSVWVQDRSIGPDQKQGARVLVDNSGPGWVRSDPFTVAQQMQKASWVSYRLSQLDFTLFMYIYYGNIMKKSPFPTCYPHSSLCRSFLGPRDEFEKHELLL